MVDTIKQGHIRFALPNSLYDSSAMAFPVFEAPNQRGSLALQTCPLAFCISYYEQLNNVQIVKWHLHGSLAQNHNTSLSVAKQV